MRRILKTYKNEYNNYTISAPRNLINRIKMERSEEQTLQMKELLIKKLKTALDDKMKTIDEMKVVLDRRKEILDLRQESLDRRARVIGDLESILEHQEEYLERMKRFGRWIFIFMFITTTLSVAGAFFHLLKSIN